MAALWLRQRPSLGFWLCALLGCGLVVAFALRDGGGVTGGDLLLLDAVLSAAAGYMAGGHLAAQMGAERVICWVLVLSLPLTVPASLLSWPAQPARASAWLGFGYVTLFSMWLGFFAWYRGLAWGGEGEPGAVTAALPGVAVCRAGSGRAAGGRDGGILAGRDGHSAGRAAHAGRAGPRRVMKGWIAGKGIEP